MQIVLNSMHRYQPRIHLVKCRGKDDDKSYKITDLSKEEHKTFIFPEAIFTAVTAYQNQLVSKFIYILLFIRHLIIHLFIYIFNQLVYYFILYQNALCVYNCTLDNIYLYFCFYYYFYLCIIFR